jgi:hypothetical protein
MFATTLHRRALVCSLWIVAVVLTAPLSISAQETTSEQKKVPKLTTEDVIRSRVASPEPDAAAKLATQTEPSQAAAPGTNRSEDKIDPEEAAWREKVAAARTRAKQAQRAAEEGELRINDLRNLLGTSGQSAKYRNETAADLDSAGKQLVVLRAEARDAAAALDALLGEGRSRGYTEASGPEAATPEGAPNEEYYKSKFAALTEDLRSAERQIELYDNRIKDLNERMNNPNVDRFTVSQFQQDRDEAQRKLDEATAARQSANQRLAELVEEARRVGVSTSVFR